MSATSPWEQEAYANAIAIVGMAGRFRGADTIEALWDVLRDGRETLHRMTGEELAAQDCPVPIMEHPCHVPVTAQLERADLLRMPAISRAMSVPALRAYSQVRLRVSTGFFTPGPRSAITLVRHSVKIWF